MFQKINAACEKGNSSRYAQPRCHSASQQQCIPATTARHTGFTVVGGCWPCPSVHLHGVNILPASATDPCSSSISSSSSSISACMRHVNLRLPAHTHWFVLARCTFLPACGTWSCPADARLTSADASDDDLDDLDPEVR